MVSHHMNTKEHYSPINLLVDILGCFQLGFIMNKFAMNTHMQVLLGMLNFLL